MTGYEIDPALVYQQGKRLLVMFATDSTNTDGNFSVVVRDSSNKVSFMISIPYVAKFI